MSLSSPVTNNFAHTCTNVATVSELERKILRLEAQMFVLIFIDEEQCFCADRCVVEIRARSSKRV